MADYLEQLIKQKEKSIKQSKATTSSKPQHPQSSKSNTSSVLNPKQSAMVQRDQQIKQLKATLLGKKPEQQTRQPTQSTAPKNVQSNYKPHIQTSKPVEKKPAQPENREMTEAEKQEMIKMIEMNANIGYIIGKKTNEKSPKKVIPKQEIMYDPLDLDFGKSSTQDSQRYTEKDNTQQNLNASINEKIRKEMGVSGSVEEIKRRIEDDAREQRDKIRREQRELDRKKQDSKREKQKGQDNGRVYINQDKEAEIKKLKMQLADAKKQIAKKREQKQEQHESSRQRESYDDQVYCRECQKRHHIDYHKGQSKRQNIKTAVDHESRELKPTVNILNMNSRRPVKATTTTITRTYVQQNQQRPVSSSLRDQLSKPMNFLKTSQQGQGRASPPKLNMLGKRDRKYQQQEDEEDEDLEGFIVSDNEIDGQKHHNNFDQHEFQKIIKGFGPRQIYSDDYDSSDMEANYDTIEQEERLATKIARREDQEQQRLIEEEEREDRRQKKLKKLEKKRQKEDQELY